MKQPRSNEGDRERSEPSAPARPPATMAARWAGFRSLLGRPVSADSLAFFRIVLGLVMALEAFSLLRPSASTGGRVMLDTYYTGPEIKFNIPYGLFEWLPMLSNQGMHAVVWLLGLGGVFMALGLAYRVSAALTFLTWGYLYALESTRTYWMSYYYLELLALFLMIWMPAARARSLDARLLRRPDSPRTVPFWPVFVLRAQLFVAYFYAGVAKLNADWLLDAVPVRNFLAHPSVAGRFEPFLSPASMNALRHFLHGDALAYFLSYAGAIFDVGVGFFLLRRRTRPLALVLLVLFHATNHFILFADIVWFPLLGVTTASIFLEPDWPARFWARIRRTRFSPPVPLAQTSAPTPAGRWATCFTVAWVAWQALFPARGYLIRGDNRFTWEGTAFSWRLKTEIYSSDPCEITISDHVIVSRDTAANPRINWAAWKGEKILYREVEPRQIDWSLLPEIVVLFEPELGERILYNPFAGPKPAGSEKESRERLGKIWKSLYGREPKTVRPTMPLAEILDGYATAIKAKGGPVPASREESLSLMLDLHGNSGTGSMIPFLRRMHPFALEGAPAPSAPFLVVEDPALFHTSPSGHLELNRGDWKTSGATRSPAWHTVQAGGEPLLIHTAATAYPKRAQLPEAFVFDSLSHPDEPPAISWDYLQDSTLSKGMHISTQPFLLRNYARRVARLWQAEYGRRPTVRARTSVSLNGRPSQLLVDPEADLASVPVTHLGHNPWIKNLEMDRIPREKIAELAAP